MEPTADARLISIPNTQHEDLTRNSSSIQWLQVVEEELRADCALAMVCSFQRTKQELHAHPVPAGSSDDLHPPPWSSDVPSSPTTAHLVREGEELPATTLMIELEYSPDGRFLACATRSACVYVLRVDGLDGSMQSQRQKMDEVRGAMASVDAETLGIPEPEYPDFVNGVEVVLKMGEFLAEGHVEMYAVDFHERRPLLLVGFSAKEGGCAVFRVPGPQRASSDWELVAVVQDFASQVNSAKFSKGGGCEYVAAVTSRQQLRLLEVDTLQTLVSMPTEHSSTIWEVAWSPRLDTWREPNAFDESLSDDVELKYLATCSDDHKTLLFSVKTTTLPTGECAGPPHVQHLLVIQAPQWVATARFSFDGMWLSLAGCDSMVSVVDVRAVLDHAVQSRGVDWDGRTLEKKPVCHAVRLGGTVRRVQFMPGTAQFLVAADWRGCVTVLELKEPRGDEPTELVIRSVVRVSNSNLFGLAVSPSCSHVAVSHSSMVHFLAVPPLLRSVEGLVSFCFALQDPETDAHTHFVRSKIFERNVLGLVFGFLGRTSIQYEA